jgi:plasmid stabilization system protein ParE
MYRVVRGREQRRLLMPKTARHIYYRLDGPERILILSVWGARRGRGPKL